MNTAWNGTSLRIVICYCSSQRFTMNNKYRDTSRSRTPWDDDLDDMTPGQKFIRDRYLRSYEQKHPEIGKSDEARFLNTFSPSICKYCGSIRIKRNGYTGNGIQRYKCLDCGRTFNVLTGTLFDDHKISISEWIEFILDIFNYGSINFTSKVNKNAYTTAICWLRKMFIVVDSIRMIKNMSMPGSWPLESHQAKEHGMLTEII